MKDKPKTKTKSQIDEETVKKIIPKVKELKKEFPLILIRRAVNRLYDFEKQTRELEDYYSETKETLNQLEKKLKGRV